MEYGTDPTRGVSVLEIVNGKRCSPLTLKEFEEFLIHEEHSEENLLFVVWYRSYCDRFAALSPALQALSPPPLSKYRAFAAGSVRTSSMRTPSVMEKDRSWWEKVTAQRRRGSGVVDLEKSSAGEWHDAPDNTGGSLGASRNAPGANPSEGTGEDDDDTVSFRTAADLGPLPLAGSVFPSRPGSNAFPTRPLSSDVHDTVEVTLDPITPEAAESKKSKFLRFANISTSKKDSPPETLPEDTPLPFAEEIALILTTFILPGASRELNLDARLSKYILQCLQPHEQEGSNKTGDKHGPIAASQLRTTNPEVFKEAMEAAFLMMETSLPRYLGWAKGNINTPKTMFWWAIGLTDLGIGLMIALVLLYYVRVRWWRIFSFIFIQFGVMQTYSASRYFCSQVHGRTSRQLYPWELSSVLNASEHEAPTSTPFALNAGSPPSSPRPQTFSPNSPNPSEGTTAIAGSVKKGSKAPSRYRPKWMGAWRKEGKDGEVLKIFGPEKVVEDEYIIYLHNKQIKEILIVGAVVTLLLEIIIVAIPEMH